MMLPAIISLRLRAATLLMDSEMRVCLLLDYYAIIYIAESREHGRHTVNGEGQLPVDYDYFFRRRFSLTLIFFTFDISPALFSIDIFMRRYHYRC